MRDPKRIRPLMEKLTQVWEMCPDLRLGQLIGNLQLGEGLYNIEDKELVEKIEDFYGICLQLDDALNGRR